MELDVKLCEAPAVRPDAHVMSCDVEDYFQVSAFEGLIPRDRWNDIECRVPRNVDRILQRLSDADAKATFFTLGWVAENHPTVVRRIAAEGHEVASHGMDHTRVWSQTAATFLEDASTSRKLLEDVSGEPVTGYRAASWSIDTRTPWAHDVIAEAGYRYSSSIYPVSHDHYGLPDAPTQPFLAGRGGVLEIPASTATLFGRRIPAAGGGYFRLFPLSFSRYLIRQLERRSNWPYVFYFHPWEVDPGQPRMRAASAKARFRHYLNLDKFERRLDTLLRSFRWGRMDKLYLNGDGDVLRHSS